MTIDNKKLIIKNLYALSFENYRGEKEVKELINVIKKEIFDLSDTYSEYCELYDYLEIECINIIKDIFETIKT